MKTLSDIIEFKKGQVAIEKVDVPIEHLKEKCLEMAPCRDFYGTMTNKGGYGVNVIAEIKRASPSAGLICKDFDLVRIAEEYQRCCASAISVLTDEEFFKGKLEYVAQVKQVVDIPVLRKDFIIDEYQVYQSRVAGADAILLIGDVLDTDDLVELMELANSLQMTVLLEVHEEGILNKVQSLPGWPNKYRCLLGINNRNLKTMKVDLDTSISLSEQVECKERLVSESGIKTRGDVGRLIKAGIRGVLIGETLMSAEDQGEKFIELFDNHG